MERQEGRKGDIDVTRRVQQLDFPVSNRLPTKGPGSPIRLVPVGYLAMISFVAKLARSPQGAPRFLCLTPGTWASLVIVSTSLSVSLLVVFLKWPPSGACVVCGKLIVPLAVGRFFWGAESGTGAQSDAFSGAPSPAQELSILVHLSTGLVFNSLQTTVPEPASCRVAFLAPPPIPLPPDFLWIGTNTNPICSSLTNGRVK